MFIWFLFILERVKGIEPSYSAWEADVLPLNYTRPLRMGSIAPLPYKTQDIYQSIIMPARSKLSTVSLSQSDACTSAM